MIARPGVVGAPDFTEVDAILVEVFDVGMDDICTWGDDHHGLEADDFADNAGVALRDLIEHRCPVGAAVRPGELDAALGFPFGGEDDKRQILLV